MSGAEIADEVAAAIAEAGAETGAGVPLAGVIVRVSGADEGVYPPTPGVETEYDCTLILSKYSARDRDGTNITDRDLRAMIGPDAETEPENGDKLRVGGLTYSVINITPYKPGGVVLYYIAQVKAGE